MKHSTLSFRWLALCLAVGALLLLGTFRPAMAAGVVGNGTPASCTEAALDAVIASHVPTIKFNCGAAVKTILITTTKDIQYTTNINGGNKIILQAKNVRHFQFIEPKVYTLKNITLKNGKSEGGGSIYNEAILVLVKVKFENNQAVSGGAIYSRGVLTVRKSTFSNNSALDTGGALSNAEGSVTATNSTFSGNHVTTDKEISAGGAVFTSGGDMTLLGGTFTKNSAFNGSALYKAHGVLNIARTQFMNNQTTGVGTLTSSQDPSTFENILVDHNTAVDGAGIVAFDDLTLLNSTISNNTASNLSGGIAAMDGTFRMSDSTVSGNKAANGAGLYLAADFEIEKSTISNNVATRDGGGIWTYGNGTLANSTLSGNQALGNSKGGGLFQVLNNTDLVFVTVANNKAKKGGGIFMGDGQTGMQMPNGLEAAAAKMGKGVASAVASPSDVTTHIQNSLFATNSGGNCNGSASEIGTRGNNLSDDLTCTLNFTATSDLNNTPAKLGPLADNGGFTLTHLPGKGSNAINSGSNLGIYQIDQRGYTRPHNGASDIGAVEVGSSPAEQ